MKETFPNKPLPTTLFFQIIQGINMITEENSKVAISNLLQIIAANLDDRSVRGNPEILHLFNEFKIVVETGDLKLIKNFASDYNQAGEDLAKA